MACLRLEGAPLLDPLHGHHLLLRLCRCRQQAVQQACEREGVGQAEAHQACQPCKIINKYIATPLGISHALATH